MSRSGRKGFFSFSGLFRLFPEGPEQYVVQRSADIRSAFPWQRELASDMRATIELRLGISCRRPFFHAQSWNKPLPFAAPAFRWKRRLTMEYSIMKKKTILLLASLSILIASSLGAGFESLAHHWNFDEGPDWHDDPFQTVSTATVVQDRVGSVNATLQGIDGTAFVSGRRAGRRRDRTAYQ